MAKARKKGGEPKLIGEGVLEDGTTEMANQYKNDTPGQAGDDLIKVIEMQMSAAAKKKKDLWKKSAGGKKSLLKSKKRAKKVSSGAIKIDKARGRSMAKARKKGGEPKLIGEGVLEDGTTEMANQYKNDTPGQAGDDLIKVIEMQMSAAAKKKKDLWKKSAGGKKSLLKSKKRAKKVSSGAIKIDKARGRAMAKARKKGGIRNEFEIDEASSKKARNTAADEIEAIADKGGAEAPALFSLASKLRKGTHSTTGLKLSKQVTSILKDNGIKEEVRKQRTAYEVVSEARKKAAKNKPQWEKE
jgi:hypothetical protein